MRVEYILDILRVDILTTWAENHILRASLDVEPAIFVEAAEVTSAEESIFGKCRCGSLRILVVSDHLRWALHHQLADTCLLIYIFQAVLDIFQDRSCRTVTEHTINHTCNKWCSLGQAVADIVDEVCIEQELLNLTVELRASDTEEANTTSEGLCQLLTCNAMEVATNKSYAIEGVHKGIRGEGLLNFALEEYAKRGISPVLITAREDNTASRKTIEKAGGILEKVIDLENGHRLARYWIRLEK